jgi:hypothetical protein
MISGVLAFLTALLPERIKDQAPFSRFESDAAHVFSGMLECALALFLFVYGYNRFVEGFSQGIATAIATGGAQNGISEAQLRSMGVLGFVFYLLHPMALISFYMIFEGAVRAFAAALSGRRHGVLAFWAIHRIAMFAEKKRREKILRKKLGPDEPDSLFNDATSQCLIVTSIEDKPWRERQIAKFGADFYILSAKSFIPKGKHYRYQYTYRRMHPGEIIRGAIAVIPPSARQTSCLGGKEKSSNSPLTSADGK